MDTTDYAEARRRMVDGQLRPNRVTDPALLAALLALPRERFVPAAHRARAYADEEVPLGGGRWMAAPMTTARLLQLAAPRTGERALVAGSGSGYGAALLDMLGLAVVAVEDAPAPLAIARAALAGHPAVRLIEADPAGGAAADGPFDIVLIEGEVPELPIALAAQLAPGGRMIAVVGDAGRSGRATIGRQAGGTFSVLPAFDLSAAPIPAFAAVPGFVF